MRKGIRRISKRYAVKLKEQNDGNDDEVEDSRKKSGIKNKINCKLNW